MTESKTTPNYVTTDAEFHDMLREIHEINFNKPMMPPLRQMRAERITSEIMQIVDRHLRDNYEAAERNVVRDIHRDMIDMFFKADVDIITEIDRVEAGLPRRNAYGLTHDEMRIRELKLQEAMLSPMPSMFLPDGTEDVHMPRTTKPEAIEMMRNLLERCAKQFHYYAENHMKKEPPDVEKAKTNAQWGHYCSESVRYYDEAN